MQITKNLSLKIVVLLLVVCLIFPLSKSITIKAADSSIYFEDFEDGLTTGWNVPWAGEMENSDDEVSINSRSLKFTERENTWDTPAFNMYNIIKQSGAGIYQISIWVYVDKVDISGQYGLFLIRGNYTNSFITNHNGNNYYRLTSSQKIIAGQWNLFSGVVYVKSEDLTLTYGSFNLCFDILAPVYNQNIYFDNLEIKKVLGNDESLEVMPVARTARIGDKFVVRTNCAASATYTSLNPSVATVDSNGLVEAVAPGLATIIVELLGETASCTIDVRSIEDGMYYVRNEALQNFMQTDDATGGMPIETRHFDGAEDQKWYFQYRGNGEYSIISMANNKALTAIVDDSTKQITGISQDTYIIGRNAQEWIVTPIGNGKYKIMSTLNESLNADWCIAVNDTQHIDEKDNIAVTIRTYSTIDEEKGQWELLLTELPTSGYEKPFEPQLWNNENIKEYVNCYAYILNNQVEPGTNKRWFQQPGEYYNKNSVMDHIEDEDYMLSPNGVVVAVKKDFEKYNEIYNTNLIFTEIGREEVCPAGTYKVALAVEPVMEEGVVFDYHWYRQNPDGTWSHKQGEGIATNRDDEGEIIYDPYCAARDMYPSFVGYFAVSAWDNLYAVSKSNYRLTSNVRVDLPPVVANEKMEQVTVGMQHEKVKELLGTQGKNIGYGTIVEQYVVEEQIVTISYYIRPNGQFYVNTIRR